MKEYPTPQYLQFICKPKEAIAYLRKVKKGVAVGALYRKELGAVDIFWGEKEDLKKGKKGFGLAHIISEHEAELKQLGLKIDDFLVWVFTYGKIEKTKRETKILIRKENFIVVVQTSWNCKEKRFILTGYDLRKIKDKNPERYKAKKASKKPAQKSKSPKVLT